MVFHFLFFATIFIFTFFQVYRARYHGVDANDAMVVIMLPNCRRIKWIHPELERLFVQGIKNMFQARKIMFQSNGCIPETRISFVNRCAESMMSLCQQETGYVGRFIGFPLIWPSKRVRLNTDLPHKLVPAGVRGNCIVCYTTTKSRSSAVCACSVCRVRIHRICWKLLHSPTVTKDVRRSKFLFPDDPYFSEVYDRDSLHKKRVIEPDIDLSTISPSELPEGCSKLPSLSLFFFF